MNPAEKQGTLEDFSSMPIERLEYLLKRQETILANKSLIHSLPDKGVKVKAFVDILKDRIGKLRGGDGGGDSELAASFERKVNIYPKHDDDDDDKDDDLKERREGNEKISIRREGKEEEQPATTTTVMAVKNNVEGLREKETRPNYTNRGPVNENDSARLHSELGGFDLSRLPNLAVRETTKTSDGDEVIDDSRFPKEGVTKTNLVDPQSSKQSYSKFKASRSGKTSTQPNIKESSPSSSLEILAARQEDALEKKNILAEIFAENRPSHATDAAAAAATDAQRPKPSRASAFRENIPLKNSPIKSIPKPESIERLCAERRRHNKADHSAKDETSTTTLSSTTSSSSTVVIEDAVHPPESVFKEIKTITLVESVELQKKLKSANESRIFEDAAARLVDRLRGAALPLRGAAGGDARTTTTSTTTSADAAVQLLGPRLAEKAGQDALKVDGLRGNLVEGSFVEYREKRDADDEIDDVLHDDCDDVIDDGRMEYDDRNDCAL